MSIQNQIDSGAPIIFIDPIYAQTEENQEFLKQVCRELIRRKVYIHVIGASHFQQASDFVFEELLDDQYSDREDLNVNLFKLEHFKDLKPSSIMCFGSLYSLKEITGGVGRGIIDYCLDQKAALIFLIHEIEWILDTIKYRSINNDPLILPLDVHCEPTLAIMVPV